MHAKNEAVQHNIETITNKWESNTGLYNQCTQSPKGLIIHLGTLE